MLIAMFIIGVLWVTFGLVVNATGGFIPKLLFKVFPFFSGLFIATYAAKALGWLSVGV